MKNVIAWRYARAVLVIVVGLAFAACASSSQPSASTPQSHPAWLVGEWAASGWEVGASRTGFQRDTTVTIAADGTWKAGTGGSGTSWVDGKNVVLEGVSAEGTQLKYTLRQRQGRDAPEMWGTVFAAGTNVEVTLKKIR
jgi:hypothetical protein